MKGLECEIEHNLASIMKISFNSYIASKIHKHNVLEKDIY